MKLNKILVIFLTGMSILLTACYSDYVNLDHSFKPYASQYNNDSTEIAFIQISKAFQRPKGIARMPDGGRTKVLFNQVKLYAFNIESQNLNEVYDFEELIKSPIRNRWDANIIFLDTFIYFKITNPNHWEIYKKWANTKSDSAMMDSLIEKYSKYYQINIHTKNLSIIDSSEFYQNYNQDDYILVSEIKELTNNVPLKMWGLDIKEISPNSDKTFIKQLIRIEKGHSYITRKAIVEQIVANKTKAEIQEVLNEMDKYKNSLQGLDKQEYEMYSKETYKLIQELL